MKSTRAMKLLALAVLTATFGLAYADSIVGQWEFNGNLDPTIGTDALAAFGVVAFENSVIGGQSASVARFNDWATDGDTSVDQGLLSGFHVPNYAGPNGGSQFYTNIYSIVMDVRFPAPLAQGWISLYQTNAAPDGNDGDLFIRPDGGMGVNGDYSDAGNPLLYTMNAWHRVALVVNSVTPRGSATYFVYVDGVLLNQVQDPGDWGLDGRFSMYNTAIDAVGFYLFGDNDGDTQEGQVNSLQFRDYAMTAAEVANLGGPSATGIPQNQPPTEVVVTALPSPAGQNLVGRRAWVSVVGTQETVETVVEAGSIVRARLAARGLKSVCIRVDGALTKKIDNVNLTGNITIDLGTVSLSVADINNDGIVDDADLTELILHYGLEDECPR